MIKFRLPVAFDDGKKMYDAVLATINKVTPPLATMIHDNVGYNPFSLRLPDIVTALDMPTQTALQMAGLEEIEELERITEFEVSNSINFQFEKVLLRFHGIDYPVPEPSKIVTSWKNRWNALYPDKIELRIPQLFERPDKVSDGNFFKIAYQNTVTHSLKLGDFPHITLFSGKVRIKAFGDDEFIRKFSLLAHFAEWCGTGAKTSMGCGVTQIERDRKENVPTSRETAGFS